MLKQYATPTLSLHNLKIYSSKGCRKTSQRWIYVASYVARYLPTYLVNTAVVNVQIFSRRYHYRLWVFASTGEYIYYWHWQVLPSVLQSKWYPDLASHHGYYRLARLIGAFKIMAIDF